MKSLSFDSTLLSQKAGNDIADVWRFLRDSPLRCQIELFL